jgi:hypothetical protein
MRDDLISKLGCRGVELPQTSKVDIVGYADSRIDHITVCGNIGNISHTDKREGTPPTPNAAANGWSGCPGKGCYRITKFTTDET